MSPEISGLTILASMCATACFMIALMYLVLWFRGARRLEHLLSTVMALAAASIAISELTLMMTTDIPFYGLSLKVQHVLIFIMLMSLVGVARLRLGGGSRWLFVTIAALWSVVLVVNLLSPNGVLYSQINELVRVQTPWGESYSLATGVTNPWKYLADIASGFIVVFLVQASLTAWRTGLRHRAVLVGGSSLLFIVLAGTLVPVQDAGLLRIPLIISFAYLAIVAALAYQIVSEALEANEAVREVERLGRVNMLGETVAGLAHEINQPLSAILSNAQAARRFLAADDIDLGEIREIIDDIICDDKRAGGIIQGIRQMLALVPEDAENRVVDVNKSIWFAVNLLTGELHARDINIKMDLKHGIQAARGDPVQIQQVLINLVLNAARAVADAPRDNRYVKIQSAKRDGMVSVSVIDRGCGIREDLVPHLFEPFVTGGKDGLGIGLTICKRIVERHGGTIRAENREGGGAILQFTLPLAEASTPA